MQQMVNFLLQTFLNISNLYVTNKHKIGKMKVDFEYLVRNYSYSLNIRRKCFQQQKIVLLFHDGCSRNAQRPVSSHFPSVAAGDRSKRQQHSKSRIIPTHARQRREAIGCAGSKKKLGREEQGHGGCGVGWIMQRRSTMGPRWSLPRCKILHPYEFRPPAPCPCGECILLRGGGGFCWPQHASPSFN